MSRSEHGVSRHPDRNCHGTHRDRDRVRLGTDHWNCNMVVKYIFFVHLSLKCIVGNEDMTKVSF